MTKLEVGDWSFNFYVFRIRSKLVRVTGCDGEARRSESPTQKAFFAMTRFDENHFPGPISFASAAAPPHQYQVQSPQPLLYHVLFLFGFAHFHFQIFKLFATWIFLLFFGFLKRNKFITWQFLFTCFYHL